VVQPTYEDAEIFSVDGLAPVKDKEWGFIDVTGKLVIPCNYQITAGGFVSLFRKSDKGFIDGLARVKLDKQWGFIKPDGTVLAEKWFENAELFQK
jgi:hypothetical protein